MRHVHNCADCGREFECLCNPVFGVKRNLCDECLRALLGDDA